MAEHDEQEPGSTATASPPQPGPPREEDVPGTPRPAAESEGDARRDAKQNAAVEAFARDHDELTPDDEIDALAHILGGKPPAVWTVPVTIQTDEGPARMEWDITAQDGRKLDRMERDALTAAGQIDTISADAALLAAATVCWRSPLTGKEMALDSDEFLTIRGPDGEPVRLAAIEDALEARMRKQWGVCANVAGEVRKLSGYDRANIGTAHRRLVRASGNS